MPNYSEKWTADKIECMSLDIDNSYIITYTLPAALNWTGMQRVKCDFYLNAMNRTYRYFLMVARECNIKQAAEKLNISQPSLTTAIKKLESDMGVALFHRRSKGVELTEYGRLFRNYVEEQQEKHSQLIHQMMDMQQRHSGKLKVGTGEAWWELFVREAIARYQQQVPNCSLHLEFGNNLSLMHHLVRGRLISLLAMKCMGCMNAAKLTLFLCFVITRRCLFAADILCCRNTKPTPVSV